MSDFNVFAERTTDDPDADRLDVDLQITRERGFMSAELTVDEARAVVDELTDAIENGQ